MPKLPNISNLSLDQLQKLKNDLAKEENKKKKAEKGKLVTQLANTIRDNGFEVEEIARELMKRKPRGPAAKKARGKAATVNPVYADPNDTNNTWTFKGRAPRWVEEQMKAQGLDVKKREDKEAFKKKLKRL